MKKVKLLMLLLFLTASLTSYGQLDTSNLFSNIKIGTITGATEKKYYVKNDTTYGALIYDCGVNYGGERSNGSIPCYRVDKLTFEVPDTVNSEYILYPSQQYANIHFPVKKEFVGYKDFFGYNIIISCPCVFILGEIYRRPN